MVTKQEVGFGVLVQYDLDLGWIIETLEDNEEWELYYSSSRLGYGHSERGRINALTEAIMVAKERKTRVKHYFQWPSQYQNESISVNLELGNSDNKSL